jgi:hypothetical protein
MARRIAMVPRNRGHLFWNYSSVEKIIKAREARENSRFKT